MAGNEQNTRVPRTENPAGLATPGGHYSHVAIGNGLVFVSGQLPIDANGRKLADASFEAQAEQVLANIKAALEGAGSSIGQLVQVRVYISDIEDWPSFNQIYARWAGDARPARAIVPTGPLHYGFKIEIEATAMV
jgi:reactive intermediate/imine deaminase